MGVAWAAQVPPMDLLTRAGLIFRPPTAASGTPTTWIFRSATDDSIVTLLIDAEGIHEGATPHGYVQLQLKAQDEVHDRTGRVTCARPPCSNNFNAYLRVMSPQFNQNGRCIGTQCPGMAEIYSDGALRLTAADGRDISLVSKKLLTRRRQSVPLCIDAIGTLEVCR